MPYQQLRRYLQSPRQITMDPADRECDPPDDPDWPAPTTFVETETLMNRLPHWAQVVCALTAAEMILPFWEEDDWVNENLSEEQIEAPRRAIETTWQWLDGEASDNEVSAAASAARDAVSAARDAVRPAWVPAARGIWAAAWAADAAEAAAGAAGAAGAADAAHAAHAAYAATWGTAQSPHGWAYHSRAQTGDVEEVYREWWALCRCRLAFILEARI